MQTGSWPCPTGGAEYAVSFDSARRHRLLLIPALFDEGNKLRHFVVEVMRRLDAGGTDCLLPDLPGTNESLAPLHAQSLESWRAAMIAATQHFSATHVLTIRGGALLDPGHLPGSHYAPVAGASQLRTLLRTQVLADGESGPASSREQLLAAGLAHGVELAGYRLGPQMVTQLQASETPDQSREIAQAQVGGPGLWLRAEPAHDPAQADRLAALVLERLT